MMHKRSRVFKTQEVLVNASRMTGTQVPGQVGLVPPLSGFTAGCFERGGASA